MDNIIIYLLIILIFGIVVKVAINKIQQKIDELKRQAYVKEQGEKGERAVNDVLSSLGRSYVLMKSVLLPTKTGSTELDHIVVSKYGIFVIETKNYSGTVKGDENSKNWIHTDRKGKQRDMYSPIKQNAGHIGTLRRAINLNESSFIPIVVFSGTAKLEIKSKSHVVQLNELRNVVLSYKNQMFTKKEVKAIVKDIKSANMDSMMNRKKHVKYVKSIKK